MQTLTHQMESEIKTAIRNCDSKMAGKIADKLRFKGWRYKEIVEYVCKLTGIDPLEWEDLMYDADE